MVDHNIVGQARALLRTIAAQRWLDLLPTRLALLTDVCLTRKSTDRQIWETCQAEGLVLLTANRSARGVDSPGAVLLSSAAADSLPVVTRSDPRPHPPRHHIPRCVRFPPGGDRPLLGHLPGRRPYLHPLSNHLDTVLSFAHGDGWVPPQAEERSLMRASQQRARSGGLAGRGGSDPWVGYRSVRVRPGVRGSTCLWLGCRPAGGGGGTGALDRMAGAAGGPGAASCSSRPEPASKPQTTGEGTPVGAGNSGAALPAALSLRHLTLGCKRSSGRRVVYPARRSVSVRFTRFRAGTGRMRQE